MNLRKFVAPTANAALRMVRAALGPDAVVLSTREAGGKTEILALAGAEADRLATQSGAWPQREDGPIAGRAGEPSAVPLAQWAGAPRAKPPQRPPAPAAAAARVVAPAPAAGSPARESAAPGDARVLAELHRLQGMVESQSVALTWMEAGHRRPLRAQLMRSLAAAGFGAVLARALTERLPDDFGPARAREWLAEAISRNLPVGDPFALLDEGGVLALVGPTGVGKTTSTAKLAARAVMRHGASNVGLVSTDTFRVGAQDQLRIYARILGVPLQVCHDGESLKAALAAFAGRRVVLVDTVGFGQRDARVSEQNAMLDVAGARRLLLVSAAAQAGAIEEATERYDAARCVGAALTKIDEAVTLGGALEALIARRLVLRFVTNGQQVPEDLHAPNARLLADRALRAAERCGRRATGVAAGALHA